MPDNHDHSPMPLTTDYGAPFLYFENAPAFGIVGGIVRVLLTAGRPVPMSDKSVSGEQVVVAQLQGNIEAMLSLRKAIDDAILLGAKPQGQTS